MNRALDLERSAWLLIPSLGLDSSLVVDYFLVCALEFPCIVALSASVSFAAFPTFWSRKFFGGNHHRSVPKVSSALPGAFGARRSRPAAAIEAECTE